MQLDNQGSKELVQVLEQVMDELLDGILVINDLTRKVAYCNKKFSAMWNIPDTIMKQRDDYTLLNHVIMQVKEPKKFLETIERLHGTNESSQDEIIFIDGRIFARKSIVTGKGELWQSRIWIFTDITKQKNSLVDSLTGCLARAAWDDEINSITKKRQDTNYCVAVIDLNDFKIINDDFGHEAGDRVLKRLGDTLQRLIRSEHDSVYRTGGDEFCMLLQSSTDISKNISKRLSNELVAAGINASIGVCMTTPKQGVLESFRKADEIMLSLKKLDKANRRGLHPAFPPTSRKTKTDEEITMLANLTVAIKKKELELAYQPIYNEYDEISWIEILCRWTHEEQLISPAIFIPLAETSDQIHRIWDWVLKESIKTLATWKKNGIKQIPLSINFSAVQVEYYKNTGFSYADQIKRLCVENEVSPNLLKIELTETSLLNDLVKAKELFDDLEDLGVSLCIDDYGTGFSSLSIIQTLPIKCIKIDGVFIQGLPNNTSNAAITKGIISMANELEVMVCAECIENKDQLYFLIEHGCKYFQGFFKSTPISLEEISIKIKS